MNSGQRNRPFLWHEYTERFDKTRLMDAQATAARDNDLTSTRNEAISPDCDMGMPQQWCLWLATLFDVYDEVALRMLTPGQLAEQRKARQILWRYCDALHDAVKTFDPHCGNAENSAVYGMTDLMCALHGNADQGCDDVDEPDDV